MFSPSEHVQSLMKGQTDLLVTELALWQVNPSHVNALVIYVFLEQQHSHLIRI